MSQRIDNGNGNIQAGGDVILGAPSRFRPNNPNIAQCPQCWLDAGRYSPCRHCNYDIPSHFAALARQARYSFLTQLGFGAGAFGFGLLYVSQYFGWLQGSFSVQIGWMIAGGILTALISFKTAADL